MPAALPIRRDFGTSHAKHGSDQPEKQSIIDKLSLDGKVTVVTGGARGIGLALSETVASLGSNVAILDLLEPEHELTDLENAYKTRFKYYRMDVTSKHDMDSVFTNVVKDFGQIDKCITSAGIALDKPFLEHTWEESSRILDINVLGSFFSAQLAAKQMVKQGTGGSIVMIASIAAHCAIPAQRVSIYGASKAAIKLLGKTLAVEMAPFNIRVNTLSPGFTATTMSRQFTEIQNVFQTAPPIGRIGRPDDLTLAVAYLLSDGASYTTGTDIAVTGGLHNGRIDV
ncbi:hypothetical protein ASPSYDRAFT_1159005 [Aspergillus sydowii CBS 593.65]|uniref:Uncharacterized protein n=1 Tax=Aspergillus sydowii CBS 593.65 TaxID=1036612 RepID=A0A1L9T7G0_9EURO|nr:uncharacterized protein ASPSYDRAFT_1159005 [Aspergillus sydowii CBS 593.65]OJJ55384.1 hypothetical protein ASPSYDRAFT_1159005 [Aspergillus sydowii CBS 593.65]